MKRDNANTSSRILEGVEIVPLGRLDGEIVERVAMDVAKVLACGISKATEQNLPQPAYQSSRGQYDSSMILNAIRPKAWKKGWKRLGMLDADLFTGGLNFVFGQADLSGPAAVISLARLKDEFYSLQSDTAKTGQRATKEALHEIGHALGLAHCKETRCVMYFSNSLTDTDRKSPEYCGHCRSRLVEGNGK